MTNFNKIVDMLPALSTDELSTLSQRLVALRALGSSPSPKEQAGSLEHWLLSQMAAVMVSVGQPDGPVWMMQGNAKSLAELRRKGIVVQEFCKQASAQRVEQTKLLRIGLDLLYKDLRNYGVPVTPAVLLRHLHRIPATIDRHFPGYAACGLLGLIIQSKRA